MTGKIARTAIVVAAVLIAGSCSKIQSKVDGQKNSLFPGMGKTFDHSGISDGCISCHKKDRPLAITGVEHGGGKDCHTCHAYDPKNLSWKVLKLFSHDPAPATCEECHASVRPAPPHVEQGDCVSCHSHPNWKTTFSFTHEPIPTSCISCHTKDRPAAPHNQDGDCVSCHKFPDWKTIASFTHDPAPQACNECHAKDRPVAPHTQDGDCVSCHKFPDWKMLASFSHTPKPATCEECHARPQATGRRAYPNQGPPPNFNANDKTFPGSGHYVGKDCVSCHRTPVEGATAFNFTHATPVVPFCLSCHYNDGRQEHNGNNVDFTGVGNCYNCHKNFANKNWDRN